jgi:pimeloyl-ACP methyl ester carboxylesterase
MTTGPYTASGPSQWVDLDGPVHYVDYGGPVGSPLVVLVHGLGGSHANWEPFAALLARTQRVIAVDLPGFGLTGGRPRSVTVGANRRLLDRFLRAVADEPVVLAGNSMGGLISAIQAAKEPATVSRLVLIDPALPLGISAPDPLVVSTFAALAVPAPVQRRLARWRPAPTLEQVTGRLLRLCVADPAALPRTVIDQHVALARARRSIAGGDADLVLAARSLAPFLTDRRRYAAMLNSIRQPVLLIHGDRDRLVPVRAARKAARSHPAWQYEEGHGLGHVPMLEAPEWTARIVTGFLS